MRVFLLWSVGLLLLSACSTTRFYRKTLKKEIETSPVFARSFTGFTLLDPETGRTLCDVRGDHYFTPASTLKILTLATCLDVLGDSVPGMKIIRADKELFFQGTADPTLLHPFFQYWQPCRDTLRAQPSGILRYLPRAFPAKRYGPGWAWEDYNAYYQAERSELPVYGNCVKIIMESGDSIKVEPEHFKRNFFLSGGEGRLRIERMEEENLWRVEGVEKDTPQFFPFVNSGLQVSALLEDTLHRDVENTLYSDRRYTSLYPVKTLYSTPLDTVLRRMMYQSDNFIAEQMLLVCAGVKYDDLRQDSIVQWAKDTLFGFSEPPPRWVDGSGLSRYNLVTPRYQAAVLWKLWREQDHARLLALFPTPGAPETTLEWWQPVPDQPWLYAKTGSMSGVQCMSGYLRTRRGKWLVFSFMNNNFVGGGRPWKEEMRRVLERVNREN